MTHQHINLSKSGMIKINITSEVSKWYAHPGVPLRLLVDCSNCNGQYELVLCTKQKSKGAQKPQTSENLNTSLDPDPRTPFLRIKTKPIPTTRKSRRALQCDSDTRGCCKEQMYVSFKELGFEDWIIAPSGYNANYCRGSCESLYLTPDSFNNVYSRILEEMKRNQLGTGLRHCCAPTQYKSLDIFYLDHTISLIKRSIPKMVVEDCGCA